ncbi:hypothetical protein EDS67_12690 [candidate division KSB1 bacterium]|nr:MAG: hypothetical protein EDS67_12690 [candidate division KSB1 bacterium]MBC6952242.1 hypothetical protein [candidate division KSB1 bacterium]MCE7943994.1 hypothetical protein [Chlorobi bacterium CHB1]MDL1878450.1 hypothetical protein [Cytophagia bacterium CHB2]
MIVLDHNIPEDEVEKLQQKRVRFRQIGHEIGRPEWDDQQEILRYLHNAKQMTFFTRDLGFFRPRLCHLNYCLVIITGPVQETASFIRRFLRHPKFKTKETRMGCVLRLSSAGIAWWEIKRDRQQNIFW